ncbi:MAG: hypothetical protein HZB65_03100 [Candidatus Aenigmarchaeota archaeon]|nr:hypothetical protein [Candidatus Aenigmarchaeota archaeon]
MKRYGIAVLLILLAIASPVFAFGYTISNDQIPVGAGDTQSIEVVLHSAVDDFFIFSMKNSMPWVTMPSSIPVLAGQDAKTTIYFSPYEQTNPGVYNMTLVMESTNTGERLEKPISITVKSANVVIEKIAAEGELIPVSKAKLKLFLKNYDNKEVLVKLLYIIKDQDGLEFFSAAEDISLGAKEFRIYEKEIEFSECAKKGRYVITSQLMKNNAELFTLTDSFEVKGVFQTSSDKKEKQELFRTSTVITVKNTGNIQGTASVRENVWGELFFSGDLPKSTGSEYTWELSLDACETKAVSYSVDYTIIPIILIMIFTILYIVFKFSTIRLKKFIIQKQHIQKGVEFTIGVEFKSHSCLKNVVIRDFVPAIFKVVDAGKAAKYTTAAGTELVWKIPELKRAEERIVSYKIIPLFSVSDTVRLPKASVEFIHLGRHISKSSWPVYLGIKSGDILSLKDTAKRLTL